MDTAASGFPAGDIRVSDAERDRALSELSVAFQAGRITADEFDERSGQVLAARTGRELTAPLADLPRVHPPAPRETAPPPAPQEAEQALARRGRALLGAGVCAFLAVSFAASSVGHAVTPAPTPAQRELMRAIVARQGIPVPAGWPPSPGFDWFGTIAPAVFALLLVTLTVVLLRRAHRANPAGRHGAAGRPGVTPT